MRLEREKSEAERTAEEERTMKETERTRYEEKISDLETDKMRLQQDMRHIKDEELQHIQKVGSHNKSDSL